MLISKEALPLFCTQLSPEPGIALVLPGRGKPLLTLKQNEYMPFTHIFWGRLMGIYQSVYRVDISDQTFSFDCHIPCQTGVLKFLAKATVTYKVANPEIVVTKKITDAEQTLEPLLIDCMRDRSRQYTLQQYTDAENAIRGNLMTEINKNHQIDTGIQLVRFLVALSPEKAVHDPMHNSEIAKIVYLPLIEQGKWTLLAQHLANHPDDIRSVIDEITQSRADELNGFLQVLDMMLKNDVIEGAQLGEEGRSAQEYLKHYLEGLRSSHGGKALPASEPVKSLGLERGQDISAQQKKPATAKIPISITGTQCAHDVRPAVAHSAWLPLSPCHSASPQINCRHMGHWGSLLTRLPRSVTSTASAA